MTLRFLGALFATVLLPAIAVAQPGAIPSPVNPGVLGDSFQVNTLSSPGPAALPLGYIVVTNTGALGTTGAAPVAGDNVGNICVNVYTFAPNQREISCCSCLVSPNGLVRISATDLGRYLPSPGVVVKLLATIPVSATAPGTNAGGFTGTVCDAAYPFFSTANLAPGMRAWATKVESIQTSPTPTTSLVQTAFLSANLSSSELTGITRQCTTTRTCSSCLQSQ